MKTSLIVSICISGWIAFTSVFGQSAGFNESYFVLSRNGGGNEYFDLFANTANQDFNSYNLGSFTQGTSSLIFKGAEHKVWKCGGCDLTSTRVYYRIYPNGSPSGSFISNGLNYCSGFSNGCGGADQTWCKTDYNTNLLNTLSIGVYQIEVYSDASVTCAGGTIYASNGGSNYIATFTVTAMPLPVEMDWVNLNCTSNQIDFKWQTASEYNSDYFIPQFSLDGKNWEGLNKIDAQGVSSQVHSYSFTDKIRSHNAYYYRLLQFDYDGKYETFGPFETNCNEEFNELKSFPNPSNGEFVIEFYNEFPDCDVKMKVHDVQGNTLLSNDYNVKRGINQINISTENMMSGIYFISITDALGLTKMMLHKID